MTDDADGPDTATAEPREGGYDEWIAGLAEGGFHLECPNGHGSLPPRRVCPECGDTDLSRVDLPPAGTVATFSEVHVAAPAFADEAPYVSAVVDFGPVRLTGVLRDVEPEAVAIGDAVAPDVELDGPGGDPLVVFRPA
ncbi:Zn-ribbon domain-containing OB-fold protein [Halorarum halobium]|uniref:Zn-ribbon domain-containing OB-fold protein n=1 Tax=Halorarum halobium TaxID=3075121 RepID=UPI0028AD9315|nr:OB-fold domain-containing protein [Halobaculum sp. XH14]